MSRPAMRMRARGHRRDALSSSQLSPADAARVAMFEYMIGNMDWSMRAGPPGEACCHNRRLIARAARRRIRAGAL